MNAGKINITVIINAWRSLMNTVRYHPWLFYDQVGKIDVGKEETAIEMNWRNVKGLILYYC